MTKDPHQRLATYYGRTSTPSICGIINQTQINTQPKPKWLATEIVAVWQHWLRSAVCQSDAFFLPLFLVDSVFSVSSFTDIAP